MIRALWWLGIACNVGAILLFAGAAMFFGDWRGVPQSIGPVLAIGVMLYCRRELFSDQTRKQ